MPIVDQIERRTYGNSETFYPMPFLSPKTMWYYKSAFNTDQMRLIDLVATIQQHVDQGINNPICETQKSQHVNYHAYMFMHIIKD